MNYSNTIFSFLFSGKEIQGPAVIWNLFLELTKELRSIRYFEHVIKSGSIKISISSNIMKFYNFYS